MRMKPLYLVTLSVIILIFAGCSGGSGTSSTSTSSATALKIADRVSVVDAQETTSAAKLKALKMKAPVLKAVSDLPSGSDYNTDESFVYVEERSAESFDIINEILCMMAQSGYDSMLNKGNYRAQIDVTQCSNSKDSASSAGASSQNQSSGSNATDYEFWTINSSRADNSSPQIVKAWIHEGAEDMGDGFSEPAKIIQTKTTITESSSSSNPYGIFTMNFRAHPEDDSSSTIFTGYLKSERDSSNNVLLKFYVDGGFGEEFSFTEKVTLNRSSDGSSGSGTSSISDSNPFEGNVTRNFNIAYSDSYFYRGDGTDDVCLSRSNPNTTVWRYGLYNNENHSTDPGGRITINSGYPVKYTSGGTSYHGWAGYYGLWFPESVTLASGDTVYKLSYSSSGTTETACTVFIARGKLKKRTKKTLTLADVANVPLSWNECSQQDGGNWLCTDTRVKWNKSTQKLMKDAVRSQATNWVWQNITAEEVAFDETAWDFNFWSESLGGSGRINLMDPGTGNQTTLANTTEVVFHVETTVYPGDSGIPASLACFENCIDPSNVNSASPYFTDSTWSSQTNIHQQNVAPADATYYTYDFDATTMELKYNGSAAVMTDSTNSQYGAWSGAMFEPTTANLNQLACDWDQTDSSTCAWQAWNKLDTFYTWETGTEQWNRLTALKENGTFVTFDPPLSVEYTHTWSDAATSKFYLEYNGFGDLWGIPGKCVDMDTGADTECWDASGAKHIRWVPEFSIPDASTVTNATTAATYYVKALEKEERMRSVDASQCTLAGLVLTTYTLPDSSLYEAPAIGDEPTVTDAPAVIGGVPQ